MTDEIAGSADVVEGAAFVTAKGDLRMNFGIPHLLSAALMCRKLGELEAANKGKEFGEFWEDILAHACAVLFLAVSALESYGNELFVDHETVFPDVKPKVMADLWELLERQPILRKYEFALLLRGSTSFNRDRTPYQDMLKVIDLRNGLMHFKPEWLSAQKEHAKLSRNLAHRATRPPFFKENEPLFPKGWVSHATAKWIVRSVLEFILEFEQRAGIKGRMAVFQHRFDEL